MGWKFFNSSGQLQTEAPIADGAITLAKIAHTNNGNDGLFLRHNGSSSDPTWAAAGGTITDLNDEADNRIVTFGSTTTELDGHEDFTWDGNKLLVGDTTASTKITKGASFDMGGNADTVMEWRSTGRITHGMTGVLDANTFGAVQFVSGAASPNAGGLHFIGVSHANTGDKNGIGLTGVMRSGEGDNSHTLGQSGSPSGALLIQARQVSGSSWGALDAGENMVVVRNHTTTKYILDADGNTYQSGNVVIGTAGKGIDFSAQTATSASGATTTPSEVLDHYEEGTWTPVFKEANSPHDAASMSVQHGKYVRIGRIVYITGWAKTNGLSNMSTSDGVTLTGLPFTVSSSGTGASWYGGGLNVVQGEGLGITANQHVTGYIEPGTTLVTLKRWGDTAGTTAFTGSNLSADGGIMFNGFYLTEA